MPQASFTQWQVIPNKSRKRACNSEIFYKFAGINCSYAAESWKNR